ncbi:MAG: hypothetical protein GC202_08650 [Alphaproteobacteria bacterium]|nr:hypothetical protein [Alphaproteobacteria bacterium]
MDQHPPVDTSERRVIINLLGAAFAFCAVMGAIGYVVTRYPELLDGTAKMVNGVAVAIPDVLHTESMTLRCRISKEYVMEPGTNQVRTTATTTNCANEPTVAKPAK